MNTITKEVERQLEAEGFQLSWSKNNEIGHCEKEDATEVCLLRLDPFMMKSIKLPKKKAVDVAWFMEKMGDKVSSCQNIARDVEKILERGMWAYPTSYGI